MRGVLGVGDWGEKVDDEVKKRKRKESYLVWIYLLFPSF